MTTEKKETTSDIHFFAEGQHSGQAFQVERLAFFSDAVFAIAITLLIIEFKVPHVTAHSSLTEVWHELAELKYHFVALLVSFSLIAVYWMRHHFLFKHLKDYNRPVVICNMFVLLPVIFFPFTTALLAESVENPAVVVLSAQLFLINHMVAALTSYGLYWLAFVYYKNLASGISSSERKDFVSQTLVSAAIYGVALAATWLFPGNIKAIYWAILVGYALKAILYRVFGQVRQQTDRR